MERCYNEDIRFCEAEKGVYSFTHEEVGAMVIQKWNFPESLTETVLRHHTFAFSDLNDLSPLQLTAVVGLADLFCLRLGIGQRYPDEELPLADTKPANFLGMNEDTINRLLEDFLEAYETDRSSLTAAA